MSLKKSIDSGKEKRKPYFKSQAFDKSCRPNGKCGYCYDNRMHGSRRKVGGLNDQLNEFYNENVEEMNNYDYPIGADNEDSPWNNWDSPDCPECGCDQFIITGEFTFKCSLCGYEEDNEPDWENLIDFE